MKILIHPLVLAMLTACGTTAGNPAKPVEVTLQSAPYDQALATKTGLKMLELGSLLQYAVTPSTVTSFIFCVTQIQLKADDDNLVDQDSVEARLGAINVSNASVTTEWGQISIPSDFMLKELSVEIHHDSEYCGTDFSVQYITDAGGGNLTKDLEFDFIFNPPVRVNDGAVFTLSFGNIVTAFNQAIGANAFTNELIGDYFDDSDNGEGTDD